jgi:hypothetical protein
MATTNTHLAPREIELVRSLRAARLRQLVLWRSTLRMEIQLHRLKSKLVEVRREIQRLMPEYAPSVALCQNRDAAPAELQTKRGACRTPAPKAQRDKFVM